MLKLGRFVVDTHVHAQRHAAGKALKGSKEYSDLGHAMFNIQAYDNTPASSTTCNVTAWICASSSRPSA